MEILAYKREYNKTKFDCGKAALTNYLQRNATKDVKNGTCTCFVVLDDTKEIIGYYTLSSESIPIEEAPEEYRKKIKYAYVPVILLGRLAIDQNQFGKGLGKLLLIDALKKSLNVAAHHVGAVAVIVDPIDEEATQYYLKYGFVELPDSGRMFMSMKKIESAFTSAIN